MTLSPSIVHLLGGLAGIGTLAALAATGTITGADALYPITGIIGVLIGTSSSSVGAASTTNLIPPTVQVAPEATIPANFAKPA